jgi:hypothetical protein
VLDKIIHQAARVEDVYHLLGHFGGLIRFALCMICDNAVLQVNRNGIA